MTPWPEPFTAVDDTKEILQRITEVRFIIWCIGTALLVGIAVGDFVLIGIMSKLASAAVCQ